MKFLLNIAATMRENAVNKPGGPKKTIIILLLIIVISIVVFVVKNDGKLIIDLNQGTIILENQKERLEDYDAIQL